MLGGQQQDLGMFSGAFKRVGKKVGGFVVK